MLFRNLYDVRTENTVLHFWDQHRLEVKSCLGLVSVRRCSGRSSCNHILYRPQPVHSLVLRILLRNIHYIFQHGSRITSSITPFIIINQPIAEDALGQPVILPKYYYLLLLSVNLLYAGFQGFSN